MVHRMTPDSGRGSSVVHRMTPDSGRGSSVVHRMTSDSGRGRSLVRSVVECLEATIDQDDFVVEDFAEVLGIEVEGDFFEYDIPAETNFKIPK